MKYLFVFLAVSLCTPVVNAQTEVKLVGHPQANYPHFHWVKNFNGDEAISLAIDGQMFPTINNVTANVYVVFDRSAIQWSSNNSLTDVTTGGAQSHLFSDDSIQQNTVQLTTPNELIAYNAMGIGVGYDIVIDVDGNGMLTAPDFIDGGDGPGCYVLHDISQPGSLAVTTADWTQTTYLTKRIWYPSNIAAMDSLPLIVISHGWTHNYTYYDYLGAHLASYGYIVMSHRNDVGNGDAAGTNTASLSLIANIDHLLANQDTLLGGVLDGKIDHHHMGWIGHSTGGESPVRAYTRLHNGENSSTYFSWTDVKFICSICPVSWFSAAYVNPYNVNYHQFIGGADTDVSGAPSNSYTQPMTIYERGTGNKHVMYVHGAGHGVFHNDSTASQWASGPNLVNRTQLHPLIKGYILAMAELYCKQNFAGQEFFTRSYAEYRPMNADSAVVISNECREAQLADKLVIDNFETNTSMSVGSCNAVVSTNLPNSSEILMQDLNGTFSYTGTQPSNGMTRARFTDAPHCLVMEWDTVGFLRYTIPDSLKDFSGYEYLSMRACQRTHHPFNVTLDSTINFFVTLTDENGNTASVFVEHYGAIIQTYQRGGGWQNEFGSIRIRLTDFLVNGTQLDLTSIEELEFTFGVNGTSQTGSLGIDDIELVGETMDLTTGIEPIVPDYPANKLHIYPNPASDVVTFDAGRTLNNASCVIYDMRGQEVRIAENNSGDTITMSCADLPPGLYLIQIVQDGEIINHGKLVVEKD